MSQSTEKINSTPKSEGNPRLEDLRPHSTITLVKKICNNPNKEFTRGDYKSSCTLNRKKKELLAFKIKTIAPPPSATAAAPHQSTQNHHTVAACLIFAVQRRQPLPRIGDARRGAVADRRPLPLAAAARARCRPPSAGRRSGRAAAADHAGQLSRRTRTREEKAACPRVASLPSLPGAWRGFQPARRGFQPARCSVRIFACSVRVVACSVARPVGLLGCSVRVARWHDWLPARLHARSGVACSIARFELLPARLPNCLLD
ncbi:hypothetical protein Droror1_Dr00014853 [Drosera rotundifolia]